MPQQDNACPKVVINDAYDKIDRFLRSALDDADYSEYSEALESLIATPQPDEPVNKEVVYKVVAKPTGAYGTKELYLEATDKAADLKDGDELILKY